MRDRPRTRLLGGGVDGNEWLTTVTGAVLIVLLAALGITIVQIGQLIWLHLFLGLLLLGPVALKLASTGYRFMRYYTHNPAYLDRGPPLWALRLLAPLVVASTVIVFASGIVLMFDGPRDQGSWLFVHKASFIIWLGVTALHVLGHLPRVGTLLRVPSSRSGSGEASLTGGDGAIGRWIVLAGAIVAGIVLAIALIPHFGLWTAPGAFHHDG